MPGRAPTYALRQTCVASVCPHSRTANGGGSVKHYDLIVLGSGSAARDAAAKAKSKYNAEVALVESTRWGGSCPNVACKPTKAYLVVADLVHDINRLAAKLGV